MSAVKDIHIVSLYPRDMNIYGDTGNILTLKKRLEWYGYSPIIHSYNPGDSLPETIDIVIGGGGQDSGQDIIKDDLLSIGSRLHALAHDGVPMLMICGLYQLFGHFFETREGRKLEGIGLLDVVTYGKDERLIGNILTHSEKFGDIIGYENHSGQTFIGDKATPLAKVIVGAGNNTDDAHEGARFNNVIGSYLHGSLLPKNPMLSDFLIETAVINRYGEFSRLTIDDSLVESARAAAIKRPR